jgi:hypothetical protein
MLSNTANCSAGDTAEMNVLVNVVFVVRTRLTRRVVYHTVYIHDPVDQGLVDQPFKNTVGSHTVTKAFEFFLKQGVRNSHFVRMDEFEDLLSCNCISASL